MYVILQYDVDMTVRTAKTVYSDLKNSWRYIMNWLLLFTQTKKATLWARCQKRSLRKWAKQSHEISEKASQNLLKK